jgi:hypothetical protein
MGRGLNQELGLSRAGETQWGSHYGSVINLIRLWYSVIQMLEVIEEEAAETKHRVDARVLLEKLETFDFVFVLHLMQDVLGFINELSQTLQKKDQYIENAMALVKVVKL